MSENEVNKIDKPQFSGEWVKLGDVCEVVTGNTPPTKKSEFYKGKDIRFYKPGDFNTPASIWLPEPESWLSEKARECARIIPADSVLMTCIGIIGKVGIAPVEAAMNQQINAVLPSNSFESRYLAYQLSYRAKDMSTQANQAVVPILNKRNFSRILLKCPSYETQQKVADKLDGISAVLEKQNKTLEKLDGLVKSEFVEMFGGIEPTIPLSSICEVFTDGDWIESKDQSACGIRLIQTGNIGNGTYRNKGDKSRYVSEETFNRLQCKEIIPGDILISRLPDPVGRACVLPSGLGRCITAVDCTILRLKPDWNASFVVWFSRMEDYSNQVVSSLTGTTRKRISRSNLGKIKVPNAEPALQMEFANFVSNVDKLEFDVRWQVEKLKCYQLSIHASNSHSIYALT